MSFIGQMARDFGRGSDDLQALIQKAHVAKALGEEEELLNMEFEPFEQMDMSDPNLSPLMQKKAALEAEYNTAKAGGDFAAAQQALAQARDLAGQLQTGQYMRDARVGDIGAAAQTLGLNLEGSGDQYYLTNPARPGEAVAGGSIQDIRGFMERYASPEQRQAYDEGLAKQALEQQRFGQDLRMAQAKPAYEAMYREPKQQAVKFVEGDTGPGFLVKGNEIFEVVPGEDGSPTGFKRVQPGVETASQDKSWDEDLASKQDVLKEAQNIINQRQAMAVPTASREAANFSNSPISTGARWVGDVISY